MTDESNESPTSQTPMWFDERPGGTTLTRPIPAQDPGTPSSGSPVRSDRAGSRRLSELAVVASLAAVLASGGTYVATRSDAPPTSSTVSTSAPGRDTTSSTSPTVSQASAVAPNWTATASAVTPSVVSIQVTMSQGSAQGSGVVLDKAGHILTNNHVVASATKVQVTLADGRSYAATIKGTDPSTDLAVVTLSNPPSDLAPIALGDSDALKVGDPVMAVGNPLGLSGTVTTGIVSALNRPVRTQAESQQPQQSDPFGGSNPFGQQPQTQSGGEDVVTNAIQTSAAINPGNSGGALVNAAGQLVGINSAIASLSSGGGQSGSIGIGFAIPIHEAKSIADQLISTGTAQHSYLGVSTQDGTASNGSAQIAGAKVAQVVANTPAARAGLRTGDVIVGIDGEQVGSADSLIANVRERAVGEKVALKVLRDGKAVTLTATLTAKAQSSS
jgi:putative serine protease PepD